MNISRTLDAISMIRDQERTNGELSEILSRLADLRAFYPQFDDWLASKVLPGIRAGERSVLTEYRDGELAALAIVKDDGFEKKLCCLRVLPGYQNIGGIGVRLFDRCFDVLGTDQPLLSVAEEQLPKFARLFQHYGFRLAEAYDDFYRRGATEFAFNGCLTSRPSTAPSDMSLMA
jgi:hypothetical protein